MVVKRRGKLLSNRRVPTLRKFNRGYDHGYNIGHTKGFESGLEKGRVGFSTPLEGTSIIIPTFNQLPYLRACIESIRKFTPEPHEIIVIDNASTDGTAEYLRSICGQVRFRICAENLGFAGGVNQGLMRARGTTMLFLNNDTIVTEGWLTKLLACLHLSDKFGLVGPVTNFISGDQLIAADYPSLSEMHKFAKAHALVNANQWKSTQRMTGFCVLMSRTVFQQLGYLDEGFKIGNCEDDDYSLRIKLMGLQLIIAVDTFIHHAGSKTITAFTPAQFTEIYQTNLQFYANKWGDPNSLLAETIPSWDGSTLKMKDFYPTHMAVRGTEPIIYWIEHGIRYLIEPSEGVNAVRLSQIDLWSFPLGGSLPRDHYERKLFILLAGQPGVESGESEVSEVSEELMEGSIICAPDGRLYQYQHGATHRFATELTVKMWNLDSRPHRSLTEAVWSKYPVGRPIIAPPTIQSPTI